ncbi:MAG: Uma2 family endonuclease [Anaerolineales bacterium]
METTLEKENVSPVRWTSADLEYLPDKEGARYEIIGGELFMTNQPHWRHQNTCGEIYALLQQWSRLSGLGRASLAPGVIFDDENDVAPDVAWISTARLEMLLDEAGHLHGAPELAIEVLSPGSKNERRDRKVKLELYSLRGVQEYWIADWRTKTLEVYRRKKNQLRLFATLQKEDTLTSPLLPGFETLLEDFFRE